MALFALLLCASMAIRPSQSIRNGISNTSQPNASLTTQDPTALSTTAFHTTLATQMVLNSNEEEAMASAAWWTMDDWTHPHPVFYGFAGLLLLLSLCCCGGFCWIRRKHQKTKRILENQQTEMNLHYSGKSHLSVPSHLTLPSTSPLCEDGESFIISPFAAVNKYSTDRTDSARTSFINASPRSYRRAKSTYSSGNADTIHSGGQDTMDTANSEENSLSRENPLFESDGVTNITGNESNEWHSPSMGDLTPLPPPPPPPLPPPPSETATSGAMNGHYGQQSMSQHQTQQMQQRNAMMYGYQLAMQRMYQQQYQQQQQHQLQRLKSLSESTGFGVGSTLQQNLIQIQVPRQSSTEMLLDDDHDTGGDGEEELLITGKVEHNHQNVAVDQDSSSGPEEEEEELESMSQSSDGYDTHTNPRTTIDETHHSAHSTPQGIRALDAIAKSPQHQRMGSMLLQSQQLKAMSAIKEDEERVIETESDDSDGEANQLLTNSKENQEEELYASPKRRKGSQAIQLLSTKEENEEERTLTPVERGHNKSATSLLEDTYLKYLQ